MTHGDDYDERLDRAKDRLVESVREARVGRYALPSSVESAWTAIEAIERSHREDLEAEAVSEYGTSIGHGEGCNYTLHATTPEMAVHFALFQKNGEKPLESCGWDEAPS